MEKEDLKIKQEKDNKEAEEENLENEEVNSKNSEENLEGEDKEKKELSPEEEINNLQDKLARTFAEMENQMLLNMVVLHLQGSH